MTSVNDYIRQVFFKLSENIGDDNKERAYLIYVAIICIILNCLLLVAYMIKIAAYLGIAAVTDQQFNIQTIEYASVYSLTFINGSHDFSYTYFFVILLGIACVSLMYFKIKSVKSDIIPTLIVAIIILVIAIVLQILIILSVGKSIKDVKTRLDTMNTFICNKIYKKGDFVDKLKSPTENIIITHKALTECLQMLKNVKNKTELAKGFYTLTLYNYYQEFSVKHLDIKGAYDVFNLELLLKNKCKPSGYMPRYGTFIEDIGETIIRPNMPSSSYINDAMYMCDVWISKTNEYANTIHPTEAYNAFIILIVTTVIINVLLVSSVYYYGIKKSNVQQM